MRALRRKWIVVSIATLVAIGLAIAGSFYFRPRQSEKREERVAHTPEAPPDLEKLREQYTSALDALNHKDYAGAATRFAAFSFKGRDVEDYRLYYLGRALIGANDAGKARRTLALLWQRASRAAIGDDAGARLSGLYFDGGDTRAAAATGDELARRTSVPNAAAAARWTAVEANLIRGDVAAALDAARLVAIRNPRAPQAGDALAVARAINGVAADGMIPLTPAERLERGVALMRDGDPQSAYDELTALEPAAPEPLRNALTLNRGLALNQLRRYEESNKLLDSLASGPFKYSIPAIYTAAKNYRALSAITNPIVIKQVTVKQQVGTVKSRVGKGKKKRTVTKPKFANVKKNVQLVDLAKKAKKESYDRLASERLRDLLQIKEVVPEVRVEVLNILIGIAEAKHQDDYEQQLIAEVVKLRPYDDPGLQHFWDKAWAAYARGDLNGAKPLFRFIADTYASPNVKRQSEYWYARTVERLGAKPEAAAIYQRIASAPYEDVYALHAEKRGAKRTPPPATNPTASNRPDWREIAGKSMPQELRLAYELTALQDFNAAGAELQKNANAKNQRFADALAAEKLDHDGNLVEMYKALKRAWPMLATVEQDSVPPYFLKMYYPVKYEKAIRKNAEKNGLDPYFVMALILQESYYNPLAKSRVGATGLMQLMPATGQELGRQLHGMFSSNKLTNPDVNIELGTFHLRHLMDLFEQNPQLVAASYNAGQGNVLKWRRAAPHKSMDEFLESIPFPETRNYVKRVTMLRSSYSRIAAQ